MVHLPHVFLRLDSMLILLRELLHGALLCSALLRHLLPLLLQLLRSAPVYAALLVQLIHLATVALVLALDALSGVSHLAPLVAVGACVHDREHLLRTPD